jgi:hypothetical protein
MCKVWLWCLLNKANIILSLEIKKTTLAVPDRKITTNIFFYHYHFKYDIMGA